MPKTSIGTNYVGQRARTGDRGSRKASLSRFCLIGLALVFTSVPAMAGTEVKGQADEFELRTDSSSTREALDALARAFGITYQLPPEASRELNGRYVGTLSKVLGRILEGTDYVLNPYGDRLEVVVLGKSGATGLAAPAKAGPITVNPAPPVQGKVSPTVSLPFPAPLPVPAVPTLSTTIPPPLASYLN